MPDRDRNGLRGSAASTPVQTPEDLPAGARPVDTSGAEEDAPRRPLSRRSEQRRAAVFALYQADLTKRPIDEVFERDAAPFTRALAHATLDHAEDDLDPLIERHARGWTLNRIAPLERAILRSALLEMLHPEMVAGEHPIPPEGAIDEAVEIAKEFCGADAPKFVNGILGTVLRDMRADT